MRGKVGNCAAPRMLAQRSNEPWPDHASGTPGRQQAPMNRAHKPGPKEICEVGRNCCKAATIKRKDDHRGSVKTRKPHERWIGTLLASPKRNRNIKRNSHEKVNGIC